MSLSDPLSVTIAPASAVSLPRTSMEENESEYRSADGLLHVVAAHSYGKRRRDTVRLNIRKLAPDVFKPAENVEQSASLYVVIDSPGRGEYTPTELLAAWVGFNTLLTASSNALVAKVLGGET
jgi:hypothetical protein